MNIFIDNLIYGAIGLLFGLAVLTVYALIQLGRRNIMTFFLIPIALVASLYAGYTMFALQGTPINKLPEGEVEVLWVEVQKPQIFFTIRYLGTTQPVYFKIPYTEDNAKKMNELGERARGDGKVEGEFKEAEDGEADLSRGYEIQFDEIERFPLPTKKSQLRRDGVDERIVNAIHNQDNEGEDPVSDFDGQ